MNGFDDRPLKEAGDFTGIAEVLRAVDKIREQITELPCSVHEDRKLVAIAPGHTNPRLCQECLDKLMKETDGHGTNTYVRRLGEIGGAAPDTAGLGAGSPLLNREVSPALSALSDAYPHLAVVTRRLGLRGDAEGGASEGVDERDTSRTRDAARFSSQLSDAAGDEGDW